MAGVSALRAPVRSPAEDQPRSTAHGGEHVSQRGLSATPGCSGRLLSVHGRSRVGWCGGLCSSGGCARHWAAAGLSAAVPAEQIGISGSFTSVGGSLLLLLIQLLLQEDRHLPVLLLLPGPALQLRLPLKDPLQSHFSGLRGGGGRGAARSLPDHLFLLLLLCGLPLRAPPLR